MLKYDPDFDSHCKQALAQFTMLRTTSSEPAVQAFFDAAEAHIKAQQALMDPPEAK